MDVLFAVMPFADANRPAIGVSLLKAGVERRGFSARVEYFSLPLAELIGYDLYEYIVNTLGSDSMAGEWFFADVAFDKGIPHEREYVSKVLARYADDEEWRAKVLEARKVRREFVKTLLASTAGEIALRPASMRPWPRRAASRTACRGRW